MTVSMPRLLAHSGGFGWDEAVFLVLPVVVLLVLARQAKKKSAELENADEADAAPDSTERRSTGG